MGIEKEDLKHIFERLYKCDKGRSEKGSGLGLSIVYQLVEKMNGKITVESEEGKGTVFTVTFPLIYDSHFCGGSLYFYTACYHCVKKRMKCKVNARALQG